jgi:hypothetical protein
MMGMDESMTVVESDHPVRPYVDRPVDDTEAARRAAIVAAGEWGLGGVREVRLLRMGMNAIFTAGGAVLRVSTPTVDAAWSIRLAEMLADVGLRVTAPLRPGAIHVDGFGVTCWEHVEATGTPIDWRAVGAMVQRVHQLHPADLPDGYPAPSPAAFPWWDFDALLVETRDAIDPAAFEGIRDAVDRRRGWADFDLTVVCHGDVHPGNVLMAHDGPVLIDWDLLCRAPAGWDHAPLMTWGERWGGDGTQYAAFAAGYGRSLRGDQLADSFAELRLVAATLMRVRAGLGDPAAMVEARRRLRYWARDPDAPAWSAQ